MATLWLAQVGLFALGWLGPWRDAPARATNGRVPLPVRMLLSLSLVLAALLIDRSAGLERAAYARFVLCGMAASFIGDLIMARLLPVPNRLIGGMAAFAAAHALYIGAYARTLHAHALGVSNPGLWLGLGLYGFGSVAGWAACIRNPAKSTALNAGALVYGTWIAIMASFALALAWALGDGWWIAAVGGLLFVSSDFLIGITEIGGVTLHNANDWIWVTYVAGQMGILYAPWIAAAR